MRPQCVDHVVNGCETQHHLQQQHRNGCSASLRRGGGTNDLIDLRETTKNGMTFIMHCDHELIVLVLIMNQLFIVHCELKSRVVL